MGAFRWVRLCVRPTAVVSTTLQNSNISTHCADILLVLLGPGKLQALKADLPKES